MRYRDERDALRHRADHLSEELREAERRLRDKEDQLAEHQRKDEKDERELAELRGEVERLRRQVGETPEEIARKRKRGLFLALGILVGMLFVGGFFGYFLVAGQPVGDIEVAATPPTPASPATPSAPKSREPADAVARRRVFWGGEVIASEGDRASIGDGCIVEAVLGAKGQAGEVEVRCGQAKLYDYQQPTESGAVQLSGGHAEMTTQDGHFVHILRYRNVGQWAGPRAQVDVDSERHRGRVFHEGADAWSVTFHLADLSFPRPGDALTADALELSDAPWRRLVAQRTALDGAAPSAVTEAPKRCELFLHPTPPKQTPDGMLTCRVTLRCGATIVYGAGTTGYVECPRPGDPLGAIVDEGTTEQNEDPKLRLDLESNEVTIEDGPLGATWKASYRLSAPKRCVPDGPWTGQRGGGKERGPLTLEAEAKSLSLMVGEGEPGPDFALPDACGNPVLALEGDGAPVLVTGPGWTTLGGFSPGDDPTPIALRRVATGK